jgi:hypothetical protein
MKTSRLAIAVAQMNRRPAFGIHFVRAYALRKQDGVGAFPGGRMDHFSNPGNIVAHSGAELHDRPGLVVPHRRARGPHLFLGHELVGTRAQAGEPFGATLIGQRAGLGLRAEVGERRAEE